MQSAVLSPHSRKPGLFGSLIAGLGTLSWSPFWLTNQTWIAIPREEPKLADRVATLVGLTVTERDKDGLRLEKYRPFPSRGQAQERDLNAA